MDHRFGAGSDRAPGAGRRRGGAFRHSPEIGSRREERYPIPMRSLRFRDPEMDGLLSAVPYRRRPGRGRRRAQVHRIPAPRLSGRAGRRNGYGGDRASPGGHR